MQHVIATQNPAPPDYPFSASPDEFAVETFAADYESRRRAYFEFILKNPAPTNPKAPWYELARLAAGATPHEGILSSALEYIEARNDCADCALHAFLRLLYQYRHNLRLSENLVECAQKTILGFKYWPDEPGEDAMCTWTENHYILFASAGYLAGQLFPEQIFVNSGRS